MSDDDEQFVVEKVIKKRFKENKMHYKIKWLGYDLKDCSWNTIDDFDEDPDNKVLLLEKIKEFEAEQESAKNPVKTSPEKTNIEDGPQAGGDGAKDDLPPLVDTEVTEAKSDEMPDLHEEPEEPMVEGEQLDFEPDETDMARVETEESAKSPVSDRNVHAEKDSREPAAILGMTDDYEGIKERQFLMQWPDGKCKLVPTRLANEMWPQLVIKYYESQIVLQSIDS